MLTATKGYYDGNTVIFDEKPAARSGSRVIVTFLQDEAQEKAAFDQNKKRSALKRLKNMDFSLREDFDADKALEQAMREKYGFVS